MSEKGRQIYIAIDLKSFYASVECVARGLDPLKAKLVIADVSRTGKTICLAVSPSLKACGIPGRPRLFEVIEKARQKGISYFIAEPQMKLYVDTSKRIYDIYSRFVSSQDIHAYSIDEVFIEANHYPGVTWDTAREFAMRMIKAVYDETGITATCGIGTNLYLSKIAMDIVAKKCEPDENGVRIAMLDERKYRETLWNHTPITDFWCVGPSTGKTLTKRGIYTMGDLARYSLDYEDELYNLFGIDAEILIDHAWGYESATLKDINEYTSKDSSLSSGQVLSCAYDKDKAGIVLREMTDALVLDLVECRVTTKQIVIDLGCENTGHIHKSINLGMPTSSSKLILDAVEKAYKSSVDENVLIRRITVTANNLKHQEYDDSYEEQCRFDGDLSEREYKMQNVIIEMKKKYGANSILRGTNFLDGATMRERNGQIGGHKA